MTTEHGLAVRGGSAAARDVPRPGTDESPVPSSRCSERPASPRTH